MSGESGKLLTQCLVSGGCLLTGCVPCLTPSLVAQSHRTLAGFEALRDSLAATSDTSRLRVLFRSSQAHEKIRRSDATAELRSGALALRLGQLGADPDFDDARASFRRAARREPGRPESWFGLGLAEAGRAGWEMADPLNLGSRVGLKALERSAGDYHRALTVDPTYTPAALALAQVVLQLRDTSMLADAARALRHSASVLSRGPPEVMLAWGRVERGAGMGERALAAFAGYLSLGGNRALALLELARTRLALGLADGEAAYYEGASLDDSAAIAAYRADLEPLVGDSVLSELDRLTGPARAAYLKRFWTDRDRLELREEGERLREHYRRLQYARIHFPLTVSRRFYGRLDAYRAGNGEVDDRG
ncbi:MAG TPA: hypothetical protein VFU40_04575, partial [Gemmatimonadales bacterium]|nr:hypothetical protein [Gemmatimonadales bacterium]